LDYGLVPSKRRSNNICLFRGSNFENGVVNKEVSRMISAMFYRHRKPKVLKSKKQHRDSHGDSHWTATEGAGCTLSLAVDRFPIA
jgi:hypothetical protein